MMHPLTTTIPRISPLGAHREERDREKSVGRAKRNKPPWEGEEEETQRERGPQSERSERERPAEREVRD